MILKSPGFCYHSPLKPPHCPLHQLLYLIGVRRVEGFEHRYSYPLLQNGFFVGESQEAVITVRIA